MAAKAVGRLRRRQVASLRSSPFRGRYGPLRAVYAPDPEAAFALVGFAVGRRCGRAVQRNRLRRRLRAAVAEVAPELAAGAYLLATDPEAAGSPYRELREAVRGALIRAGEAASKSRGER